MCRRIAPVGRTNTRREYVAGCAGIARAQRRCGAVTVWTEGAKADARRDHQTQSDAHGSVPVLEISALPRRRAGGGLHSELEPTLARLANRRSQGKRGTTAFGAASAEGMAPRRCRGVAMDTVVLGRTRLGVSVAGLAGGGHRRLGQATGPRGGVRSPGPTSTGKCHVHRHRPSQRDPGP